MRCEERAAVAQTLESSLTDHHARQNPLEQDTIHHAGIAHARCPPHAVGAQWLAGSAHAALCRGHQPTGEPGAVAPLSHHYTAGAAGRVRDGPARSRRASADGVDQSGGAASRPSDRPCAQRVVSGSRKAPSPSNKPAHSTPVCPRLQASIGHENTQVDRVAVHIQATLAQAPEAASIAAPINSAMTMICPDDAVAGERSNRPTAIVWRFH